MLFLILNQFNINQKSSTSGDSQYMIIWLSNINISVVQPGHSSGQQQRCRGWSYLESWGRPSATVLGSGTGGPQVQPPWAIYWFVVIYWDCPDNKCGHIRTILTYRLSILSNQDSDLGGGLLGPLVTLAPWGGSGSDYQGFILENPFDRGEADDSCSMPLDGRGQVKQIVEAYPVILPGVSFQMAGLKSYQLDWFAKHEH